VLQWRVINDECPPEAVEGFYDTGFSFSWSRILRDCAAITISFRTLRNSFIFQQQC